MADEIIIEKPIEAKPVVAITKEDFIAMAEADKIKVLIAEKEAELEAKDLDKLKSIFYEARDETFAAFDDDAKQRIGDFISSVSVERTVLEKKFADAEALGTWEIPL